MSELTSVDWTGTFTGIAIELEPVLDIYRTGTGAGICCWMCMSELTGTFTGIAIELVILCVFYSGASV